MSVIIDNLILASRHDIMYNKDNTFNISRTKLHINLAEEINNLFDQSELTQIKLNWKDSPHQDINKNGILFQLVKIIDTYLTTGEQVLVNCFAGVSRSATVVIAYLMYKNKWTIQEAIAFVKSKRRIIKPNSGFICQLYNLQEKLHNLDEHFIEYCSIKNKSEEKLAEEIMETCKIPLIERIINNDDNNRIIYL